MPAISAFIVPTPEAESIVQALRLRHDPTCALGVPAHVTVLVPFKDPAKISAHDLHVVRTLFGRFERFAYSLTGLHRWPEVAYLAVKPEMPFIAMTRALADTFPDFPPYQGAFTTVVPHLTIAHGSASGAEQADLEFSAAHLSALPLYCEAREVQLIENSSGQWSNMATFPLAQGAA